MVLNFMKAEAEITSLDITAIQSLRGRYPLYVRYPREFRPQDAYITLDEDGRVGASPNFEINAVPADVWNKRTIWIPVSPEIGAAQIRKIVKRALPLLERVHAGHSVEWDGSNMRGRLTDDASEALVELCHMLHYDDYL